MDQQAYMTKVDRALAEARRELIELADRNLAAVREELQHQHGARKPGALGYDPSSFLAALRASRAARAQYLPARLFADPAWDILLELTVARIERRDVTVKVVQAAARVPAATSIRWMHVLETEGLLTRRTDPLDRRRTFVALTEAGWKAMSAWLDEVAG